LHHDPQHSGFIGTDLHPPFRRLWVRHCKNERLGSAMEPIVTNGRLFVATHQGNLYALRADTGNPLWRFSIDGAFIHSPVAAEDLIVAAGTDGQLYAVDAERGTLRWKLPTDRGGCAASPMVA